MSNQQTQTPPATNPTAAGSAGRPDVTHGAVDDPGASALQEGDHGLNGDLRATMLAALQSSWTDPDNPPEDIPDDAAAAAGGNQPDPASSPDPASQPGDGGQAGAGGEPPAGTGAAPGQAGTGDPSAPPSTGGEEGDANRGAGGEGGDAFSLDRYAQEYFGTQLTRDQARDLFGVLGGLQQLTPEQRQMLDATLAGEQPGQYPATTGQPAPPLVQQPVQQVPGQQQLPPAQQPLPQGLPPRPDDEYEAGIWDRYIAPLAQTFDSRLGTIQEQIAQTTQQQLARQQQEMDAQIAQAANDWRSSHPDITDGEYDALTNRIIQSGVFPPLVRAHGSPTAATQAALDQFFWADERLRSRAMANLASGRTQSGSPDPDSPEAAQAAEAERQRQARASAVTGGGGSTTPRGDQQVVPKTRDERQRALVETIRAEGNFTQ